MSKSLKMSKIQPRRCDDPISDLFPDKILFEIVTRLPTKAACRFKTLSKRLNTLLTRYEPSVWVPLDRTVVTSSVIPTPTHFGFLPHLPSSTLYINPELLLKPDEPILGPDKNPFPTQILHANSGFVLFTVNVDKYLDHCCDWVVDLTEHLLFITNPLTKEWARLPINPLSDGPKRMLERFCYALVASPAPRMLEFVVGMMYPPRSGMSMTALACYSTRTGKWVMKKASYPLGKREWSPSMVFVFKGKIHWVDLSVGVIKWVVDDVFASATSAEEDAVCVFIPLPSGRVKQEMENLMGRRWVGPAGRKWIQYVEMMEGDGKLDVWRLEKDGSEWKMVYSVSRFDIERGIGLELTGVPNVEFVDPFNAHRVVMSTEDRLFRMDVRSRKVVGEMCDYVGKGFIISLVLPKWPTSLPPLLYADYVKEQGNGHAKAQDFINAIKCYSKSISLSPNADAYASRAVAYLEVGRIHEAEDDCTEALSLDVGFCKAYVQRAMVRKELGNLEGALEDVKSALSLDLYNEELKKTHAEIESLLEKDEYEVIDDVDEDYDYDMVETEVTVDEDWKETLKARFNQQAYRAVIRIYMKYNNLCCTRWEDTWLRMNQGNTTNSVLYLAQLVMHLVHGTAPPETTAQLFDYFSAEMVDAKDFMALLKYFSSISWENVAEATLKKAIDILLRRFGV